MTYVPTLPKTDQTILTAKVSQNMLASEKMLNVILAISRYEIILK